MMLELMKPAVEHGPEYLAMVDEGIEIGEGYPFNDVELARNDFAAFVQELEEEARGIGLPPGIPAQQTYLLVKDGRMVVGEIRFRPYIQPPYERYSGHVGYNIRPSQRGKGYATRQLALVLDEARNLGLSGVSLTIDSNSMDPEASIRVIEKNGGRLLRNIDNPLKVCVLEEDGELVTREVEETGERVSLYWIDLVPQPL